MRIQENIKKTISKLEEENNIKVLLAIESGSRAWGFPSEDSDYDCRFIYVHNKEFYIALDEGKDYIELPVDEVYDVNGWDIKKSLKAVRKNNPTIFEWLQSPIIYKQQDGFKEEALSICEKYFDGVPVLYHYVNTAKNKIRILESDAQGKIKAYFYVLRPLLACKWVMKNNSIPPMEFFDLLNDCEIDSEILGEIKTLLKMKESATEGMKIEKNITILNFCNNIVNEVEEYLKKNKKSYDKDSKVINEFLRKVIGV